MNFIENILGGRQKSNREEIDFNRLPEHIAIIMDGNRRWAQKKGVSKNIGHREGANCLKKIASYCNDIGIKVLTVYAFSTENWKRTKEEVDGLMSLLKEYLSKAEEELGPKNVKIRVVGDLEGLPLELQNEIARVEELTRNKTGLIMNIALNYGGRLELINAVKKISSALKNGQIKEEDINEELISENLYTKGLPDPDLVIRTSGEQRISNFLLWQIAYSELWFEKTLWPDFNKKTLNKAIYNFQNRERKFGGK